MGSGIETEGGQEKTGRLITVPVRLDKRTFRRFAVFDALREGDPFAEKLFRRYVSCLSQSIANVVNFLDPEVILLGGGVSKAGDVLLNAVREEYPKYVVYGDMPMPPIRIAALGADAGIIGAAMLS